MDEMTEYEKRARKSDAQVAADDMEFRVENAKADSMSVCAAVRKDMLAAKKTLAKVQREFELGTGSFAEVCAAQDDLTLKEQALVNAIAIRKNYFGE